MNKVQRWLFPFLLFLPLRLVLILRLPIFNDESTYLRWGRGVMELPSQWLTYTLDGKQPFLALTTGLAQTLPIDPLIAARLVNLTFAIGTFFALWFIAKKLWPKESPVILAVLTAGMPFLLLHDVLVTGETVVVMVATIMLYLTIRQWEAVYMSRAVVMGLLLAFAWWYRSSVLMILPALGAVGVAAVVTHHKERWKFISSLFVSLGIFLLCIAPLLVRPEYQQASETSRRLLVPWAKSGVPFAAWAINIRSVLLWFAGYGTPFLFLAGLFGVWKSLKDLRLLLVLLWFLVPLLALMFGVSGLSARNITLVVPPFILLASYGLARLPKNIVSLVVPIVLITTIVMGSLLAVSPLPFYRYMNAVSLGNNDMAQYVVGWTSGYGVKEAAMFLQKEIGNREAVVLVREFGGNPDEAMPVYLWQDNLWIIPLSAFPSYLNKYPRLRALPMYFVSREKQYAGLETHLTELARFPKPLDPEFVGVYRFTR